MLVKSSMKLLLFASVLYSGASLSIMISSLPLSIKLTVLLLVVFNAKTYINRHIFLDDPHSVISLWKNLDGYWSLKQANAETINAMLKKNSLVTDFLLVLIFYTENHDYRIVLLTPESVGLQDYRRLLVLLYHGRERKL